MPVFQSTLRRTLVSASFWPTLLVTLGASWVAAQLVSASLGPTESFLAEIRQGCMLFGGLLVLSLAEPLQVGREAREGILLLRAVRANNLGLLARWLGLLFATLPAVLAAAIASGGLPSSMLALISQLAVLAAGGLLLGSFLERGRLVPALWVLAVVGQLRPWLARDGWGAAVAWLLPDLAGLQEGKMLGLLHAFLWVVGALCLTRWRLLAVAARGPWPTGVPKKAAGYEGGTES
jgi:hypothetical protein